MPTTPLRLLLVEDPAAAGPSLIDGLDACVGDDVAVVAVAGTAAAAGQDVAFDVVVLHLPDDAVPCALEELRAALPDTPMLVAAGCPRAAAAAWEAGAVGHVLLEEADPATLLLVARDLAETGRLRQTAGRLAHRQRVLAGLGRDMDRWGSLPERLGAAAGALAGALEARSALVLQRRMDGRYLVQSSHGEMDLDGVVLPALLAVQLSPSMTDPVVVADPDQLEASAFDDAPAELREVSNFTVLPLHTDSWSGAIAFLDTPCHQHEVDVEEFLRAAGAVLAEVIRRSLAEFDRNERVKELTALATIGRIVQEPAAPCDVVVAVGVALATGMQHAESAVSRIQLDDHVAVSDGGSPQLAEELTAPIAAAGAVRGEVAIGHRTRRGFLRPYEQQLVDATAETLSLWTERCDTLERTKESEARLRSVLAQMPGIVWSVDRDLRIQGHDGRGHELIGLAPNQYRGRHLTAVAEEEDPAVSAVRAALGGEAVVYESQTADRIFETHAGPLHGVDGEVTGAVAMSMDVTESRVATAALEESRHRLQGLFDNAIDAFILADDDGRCVDANRAAEVLTGRSRAELRTMMVGDLTGTDRTVTRSWYEQLRAAGELTGEEVVQRADGSAVAVEFRAAADIVPGVHLAAVRDVTERRRAELALRSSEARFRRLAENARDVIYRLEVTDQPRLTYVSPAVSELVGLAPEDLYDDGERALRMLTGEDRRRFLRCVLEPRRPPAPFVARLQPPRGEEIWVEERHSYVLDDDGRHVATEGVVRDITARKRIEDELRDGLAQEQARSDDLEALNEMKDVFLTAVSHELRTPLAALKGIADTLDRHDERLDRGQRQLMHSRLIANADRLEHLLEDLLDVDRLTRGILQPDLRRVDVGALVLRTVEATATNGRPVTACVEEVVAMADEPKVQRIVENLVVNACRHTAEGGPIWVRVAPEGDGVGIWVEDAGPGIPEEQRELVFEAFAMGDSPAAKVSGMGVGLNLVKRFAELHDGRVEVGDRAGGGASFHVWLPSAPGVSPVGGHPRRNR